MGIGTLRRHHQRPAETTPKAAKGPKPPKAPKAPKAPPAQKAPEN